jgi:hypothetical protein
LEGRCGSGVGLEVLVVDEYDVRKVSPGLRLGKVVVSRYWVKEADTTKRSDVV